MKLGSKRGSAVLEAPEDSYVSHTGDQAGTWEREPAPAGSLRRATYTDSEAYTPAAEEHDEPYISRRGSIRFRLRGGVPKSVAGRILTGGSVLAILGVAAVTVFAVRSYLMHDDRFAVATSHDIEITGNDHLTRAQLLSVFGADLERNIFKVPLAERRTDLERLPWVQHATVMRLLPNRVRISVTERVPVAFVRQGTQIGLVDATGVLLDMPQEAAGDPHYSFPVLTGLAPTDPLSTRAARMEIYRKFMAELDGTGEHLTKSLSEVDVSNPEDVKALVASSGADILVHFGDEEFLNRYREFQQHLPEWHQQYPKLASADMRYERQIVLEMQQGATVPTNTEAPAADAAPKPMVATSDAAKTSELVPAAKPATLTPVAIKPVVKPVAKPAVAKASAAKATMAQKLALARAAAHKPASKPAASSGVSQ